MPRQFQFGGEFRCRIGPLRVCRHPHQHAHAVVCKVRQPHGLASFIMVFKIPIKDSCRAQVTLRGRPGVLVMKNIPGEVPSEIPSEYVAMESPDLTSFLEQQFHELHRWQLPEIFALAEKVERVHAADAHVPKGLAETVKRLAAELDAHMRKEEMVLFPAIRHGGMQGLSHPIAVMRADHDDLAREMEAIMSLTSGLTLPAGACQSWTSLYEKLRAFMHSLDLHTRIENDVLFPRFEKAAGSGGCGCNCGGHG